jgi:hypothetical protein
MAWNQTVAGVRRSVQLLEDNDPAALDTQTTPKACDNLLALAELAVYKAFVALNVPPVQRRNCREDAVQEAALILTDYAGYGPRPAYSLARKRVISWIIRQMWQGRLRRQAGRPALIPSCFSLDEAEGEAWIPNPADYSRTPEEVLLAQEETDLREVCVEQFYDIAYDLVAYRMGLKRCRHVAASNDTAVFQLTLRGNNYAGVAAGLGCSENLAIQRVTYARRRLAAFIEAHRVEVIAAWYTGAEGERGIPDVRAGQAFIAEYVATQEERYRLCPQATVTRRLEKYGTGTMGTADMWG